MDVHLQVSSNLLFVKVVPRDVEQGGGGGRAAEPGGGQLPRQGRRSRRVLARHQVGQVRFCCLVLYL